MSVAAPLTVSASPVATFTIAPSVTFASAASRFARDDVLDEREVPRLLAVAVDRHGGSPAAIRRMKRGMTAAYCEFGSWRGPNTLK